ncbi:TPA: low molecular weight phosphotyrosine protein phosphatase [Burkholderia vietnamiensis]|uniref:low molecular weight protein-tyrosine-phosphatase n=1 Tax=Burkholderia vietnamiensis TaxID=60552 RepID=UPI000757523C|nr:low molecular weight protein-tyrosine-phosphatase [Burkholderia vietnamiensis]KVS08193.1 protein tyrosine phosphatase [Burkholderia vietnamiensis]MCA8211694.1 low molecular weight phosphotyrosine protein phosphatase [Burkholderia vietnamiensis]HDR9121960.1 low molecular weight phosphotyrosine protein phosphatase [Burkholderia vietnamiensis]HDR9282127.1 low molecular weight phosphotyrosine protein phosphatase [Burkholderia vietnamiensis]
MIDTILVVCEGNICRSPMAEALLARALPAARIRSAGCSALAGRRADPLAVELMAERGIDLGQHIAVDLNLEHMRSADLILTMTQSQRKRIEAGYPFAKGRVFRLGEFEQIDVTDPYRRGRPAFELALTQIDQSMKRWVDKVNRIKN